MIGGVVLGVIVLVLWVLGFISRRRFGVLGLALAAGALMSMLWSSELIGLVEQANLTLASVSTAGLVSAALVLLPAFLLLFSGPAYRSKKGRAVGATLFAVFATVLIVEPFSSALVLDSVSRSVFDEVAQYQVQIATAGVVIALVDTLAIHTSVSIRPPKAKS